MLKLGDCWADSKKVYEMFLPLVTRAELSVVEDKDTLTIFLYNDTDVIVDLAERQRHFCEANRSLPGGYILDGCISGWQRDIYKRAVMADKNHPLLLLFGSAAPWFLIKGQWYCWFALRDIMPIGLVIPGGSSRSLHEILEQPHSIIAREVGEEMIIMRADGQVLVFNDDHYTMTGRALAEMDKPRKNIRRIGYLIQERPWAHARNMIINLGGKVYEIEADLTINPKIGTISLAEDWQINLDDWAVDGLADLRLYDGERGKDGKLLGRDIVLCNELGCPVAIYRQGEPIILNWANPESIVDPELTGRGQKLRNKRYRI